MRIDLRAGDRLVAGESLGQPNIVRVLVEIRDGRVANAMKREAPLEAGSRLPDLECVAHLPRRQPVALAAYEKRRVGRHRLVLLSLPPEELLQLCLYARRQHDLLSPGVLAAAFEDSQLNSASCLAIIGEHVADV